MSRKSLGLLDYIGNEMQHAVHDVRQKVFEEGFFGRVVTAVPVMEVREPMADKTQAARLAELWGPREPDAQRDRQREREEPKIER